MLYIRLIGHILISSTLFVIVALPALSLEYALHYLEERMVSSVILLQLEVLKEAIFGLDVALYLVCLVHAGWQFIRGMKWL
jgi:hypothetical protein